MRMETAIFSGKKLGNFFQISKHFDVLKPHLVRYSVLITYTLLITHFISYSKIPFTPGYEFPWFSFIALTLFSIPICTANWFIFQKLKPKKVEHFAKRILAQVGINTVITLGIYTVLFWLMNIVILGGEFSWFIFLKYLMVCLTLVVTEVAMLTAFELYKGKTPVKSVPKSSLFIFHSGRKSIQVLPDEIHYLHSKGGIISLFLEERKYTTDFHSLDEVFSFTSSREFLSDQPTDNFASADDF